MTGRESGVRRARRSPDAPVDVAADGPVIVAFGGGVNSEAVAIELVRRGERVDLFLFSDPGGEWPETYENLPVIDAWLRARGYPGITRLRKVDRLGAPMSLERNCLDHRMLPSLAYGFKRCSQKFKREPQDKYVNNWAPARDAWSLGQRVVKIIGFHAGEHRRVDAAPRSDGKYAYRYPLVEWGWDNERCATEIRRAGLPVPRKSSCFFCPATKRLEILDLRRRHPALYQRALALEANAELVTVKGLGRRFSWRNVDEDAPDAQLLLPCDCFDGGSDDDAEVVT